ncbi:MULTISPECIES: galactose/methyl galactoside ABC transporter permease MglC [Clostridium]|uniref:Galactoside transport system permease protein MglC n=2 Tax=Clostridium TaxID=1485 RepID=A0A151AKD7_9CLOT|nr:MULTISPECIES: galactose/methyl galactoside ABC transporter permease MglC [Clostridium]KYH28129.1 galactoside transport system permease protein MglC [Clostridium colicanis DSM 13634]PRR70543.1 Galactoside transport system permease protein MglC [Clostridium thermopalmarium DSM 5974]PVZ21269.1 methyl-galactoside transport system permease protein [Clostridium thermopalmarium DSM 5974]
MKISEKKDIKSWMVNNAILVVLVALLVIIVVIEPSFISLNNFRNILSQASTRVIIALGIGAVIITQGTDLSAGRIVGLSAVVSASLLQSPTYAYRMYPNLPQLPIILPILIATVVAGIIGLINGLVISKLKVTPFITTLGTQIIVYGLTSTYFDRPPYGAQPIGGLDPKYMKFAQGSINIGGFRIPYLVIYAAIVSVFIWILWNKTRIGKNIFAVGGNPEAAVVSGVDLVKTLLVVYILAGALYGFAGSLEAARVGSATNNTGNMYELDAIAACVVGGVSFTGGIGTVSGIIIGVLIFQVINYGLAFIGVNPYLQYIIKGLIIIIAVAIDTRKYIKKK